MSPVSSLIQKLGIVAAAIVVSVSAGCETSQTTGHSEHSGPVMNYHRIDERLVTGGHLIDDGVTVLQAEGVAVVIDLRDKPPPGERERLADKGIGWINVPVVWRDPTAKDFAHFREIMQSNQDKHVLVQCAANYRASAMTYLYRVVVENVDEKQAAKDLHAVWNPKEENERWSRYIDDIKRSAH